ncbi:MAG: hypothetical protein AB2693_13515 [Candidatus Thiodiazotropha sp.]
MPFPDLVPMLKVTVTIKVKGHKNVIPVNQILKRQMQTQPEKDTAGSDDL